MKKLLLLLLTLSPLALSAQVVAKMQIDHNIPGLCYENEVYVLLPGFSGQVQAVCPVSKNQILEKLNNEVKFIKDNPKHNDKGMVSIVTNCDGKVVECQMDTHTKNKDLDAQVLAVFSNLGKWEPGKINGKRVDSITLYSFRVKSGKIIWD